MAATDDRGENVRVAVLGTGIMGSAMARNLVSAGLRTTVWDRSPAAAAPLSGAGAAVTASPAEAVQDAQVVITMLPTADVVNSVIFDDGGQDADTAPELPPQAPARQSTAALRSAGSQCQREVELAGSHHRGRRSANRHPHGQFRLRLGVPLLWTVLLCAEAQPARPRLAASTVTPI